MFTLLHVVGARPNFIKLYPVFKQFSKNPNIKQCVANTGQHFDYEMSTGFFDQLQIPKPNYNLECDNTSVDSRLTSIFTSLSEVIKKEKPDLCLVYGDVDSTLAAALTCVRTSTPLGHVEAGLRSFDMNMPEEINRRIVDHLADLLFTHCDDADDNLLNERIDKNKVYLVGNVMIDTLIDHMRTIDLAWGKLADRFLLSNGDYCLVTLHRKGLLDSTELLSGVLNNINVLAKTTTVLFPAHPKTDKLIQTMGFVPNKRFRICKPLNYLEFVAAQKYAKFIITDSGGVQEESSFLGVPCFTVRNNTERPITVISGTNKLVGVQFKLQDITVDKFQREEIPLWDGCASQRLYDVVISKFNIDR
jgi:UDP-N-acetylglucosamine 2-epimerase (non-hydrolysing)